MNIPQILADKYPGAEWVLTGNDYEGLEWLDDSPKPTEAELEAAWPEVQHARQVATVEQARAQAYRETADPMFFRYQAGEATEQEWLDARQAVRDAHPYPEQHF
jgi:hypothetical protein